MFTSDQLDALQVAAEAATPGEWVETPESGENGWYALETLNVDGQGTDVALRVTSAQDATFIATANPAVVLELVAAHRAALARIARVEAALSGAPECDQYKPDDVITCGWKNAVAGVQRALADGEPSE